MLSTGWAAWLVSAPWLVADAAAGAAGYCTLEYDLARGRRGSRQDHVEGLLCRLTGAQAALAVNISAARGLQDVLRTNLGPKGTMKM